MKTKLIKISDTHYIVVDDSEIKEGDWYYDFTDKEGLLPIYQRSQDHKFYNGCKKITHSTQPLEQIGNVKDKKFYGFDVIQHIFLLEVEEAINGYSVEKMAKEHRISICQKTGSSSIQNEISFIAGFKAHRELVFTELENKLFNAKTYWEQFLGQKQQGIVYGLGLALEFLNSSSPTEWDIEFIYPDNTSLEMSYAEEMYELSNPKIKLV